VEIYGSTLDGTPEGEPNPNYVVFEPIRCLPDTHEVTIMVDFEPGSNIVLGVEFCDWEPELIEKLFAAIVLRQVTKAF